MASAKGLMQVLAQKRAAANAAANEANTAVPGAAPNVSMARLEELAEQILQAIERPRDEHEADFSVSKLLAGIVQIVALATLLLAYAIFRNSPIPVLLIALFLQLFTIALLIMGRQK